MEPVIRFQSADVVSKPPGEGRGDGIVRVERAELEFFCDPPLDAGFFPGPALRGLLGRLLEKHGGAECMDFLLNRFKGEHVCWKLGFYEAPRPEGAKVLLSTFGPRAAEDLAAAVSAFTLPGAELHLPGLRTRLALSGTVDMEGVVMTFVEDGGEPHDAGGEEAEIHFFTPVCINRAARPWRAADWGEDATPLIDSIRLRFADLAGIRRKSMPQAPSARFENVAVWDVQLDLPVRGKHERLAGILGSARFGPLPPYSRSLLEAAGYLGLGRSLSFGFGTVQVVG